MDTMPYRTIVYVRGYAGTQSEVEETAADPYMGFNLGATKLRQRWTGEVVRHVFESPLIRLMKDHGYTDAYRNGSEFPAGEQAPQKSVWIYRYYEPVSQDLGTGQRPEIEDYARGLDIFLRQVRARICGDDRSAGKAFKVYLVAHSLGGLIIRCYLQNVRETVKDAVAVDKVFTYATPHGGIDFRLIGNVPAFIRINNIENFNEARMREYLKIDRPDTPVNSLDGAFPTERFFCLVGTNARDYEVAGGLSSAAVGPMSDGLVQIKNAYVSGSPRAYVFRSHSGHYGVINSEEGYQNLCRFLFGDVRVDGLLHVDEISYPPVVERARQEGKKIRASYHIEIVGRMRGARWDLHRRLTDEQSAIFRKSDEMVVAQRPVHLFSAFLAKWATIKKGRRQMGFSIDLGVLVPEYEIDGFLFLDEHYEGGYLFRDKLNLTVTLQTDGPPKLRYGWDSRTPNRVTRSLDGMDKGTGNYEFQIPVIQNTAPGLRATLLLRTAPWA